MKSITNIFVSAFKRTKELLSNFMPKITNFLTTAATTVKNAILLTVSTVKGAYSRTIGLTKNFTNIALEVTTNLVTRANRTITRLFNLNQDLNVNIVLTPIRLVIRLAVRLIQATIFAFLISVVAILWVSMYLSIKTSLVSRPVNYFEEVYETQEVVEETETITANESGLMTDTHNDTLITDEEDIMEAIVQTILSQVKEINEESRTILEIDEESVEISNMEEFLIAVDTHLADNASKALGLNGKTIEYKAKAGKKCSKGYRRVGDKCVLISYLKATKTVTKRP